MEMIKSHSLVHTGGDHILENREKFNADGMSEDSRTREFGSCLQLNESQTAIGRITSRLKTAWCLPERLTWTSTVITMGCNAPPHLEWSLIVFKGGNKDYILNKLAHFEMPCGPWFRYRLARRHSRRGTKSTFIYELKLLAGASSSWMVTVHATYLQRPARDITPISLSPCFQNI